MEIDVVQFGGGKGAAMTLPDSFAARKFNPALVHQAVCACMANIRQGTRAQKTRAEVSHTTRKLFRQKGGGRARGGMSSSPIRRGGGRAFPSRPDENFRQKLPRRMFRSAMAVMFSQLLREKRLVAVQSLEMDAPKTAALAKRLRDMDIVRLPVILVDTEISEYVGLSARNLPGVACRMAGNLTPSDLARAEAIVMTERALESCAKLWGSDEKEGAKS